MRGHEILSELYDANDDNYTFIDIDHMRRPRITLRHLQKLRKTRSIEELETIQRMRDVSRIYSPPAQEQATYTHSQRH